MTTVQQLVVAIFRDGTEAGQALNELHQVGFDNRHLRFAGHRTSTGGLIEKIKSVFTGEDVPPGGIYTDLVSMGTPPEDAHYYQSEFDAGRTIIAVVGTGAPLVAVNILAHHGGYGANQRFAESTNYGRDTNVQEPANKDVNAQPNLPNQRTAPPPNYDRGPDMQEPANVQEPTNEDVNAQPSLPNQRTVPPPDQEKDTSA